MSCCQNILAPPTNIGTGTSWLLLGNSGTNPSNNFLGTIDSNDVIIKANNITLADFSPNNIVTIGDVNNIGGSTMLSINDSTRQVNLGTINTSHPGVRLQIDSPSKTISILYDAPISGWFNVFFKTPSLVGETFLGGQPTGSISLLGGAGTGASVTYSGSSLSGIINITTGTGTTGTNSVIATVQMNCTAPGGFVILLTPNNPTTLALSLPQQVFAPSTTISSTWNIVSGASALDASTLYSWNYFITIY